MKKLFKDGEAERVTVRVNKVIKLKAIIGKVFKHTPKSLVLFTILVASTLWSWGQHTIQLNHKYYTVQFDTVFCQGILNHYTRGLAA